MRKLEKKFIKRHSHQEIVITGSKIFSILEYIGIWMHIMAFAVGLLTIVGVSTESASEATHILEIVTLVIVGLILLQYAITPFLERIMLRFLLKEFWGTNEIATSLRYATDIDPMLNFGTVIEEVDSVQLEETKLEWTITRWFPLKRVLTIQQCTPVTTKRWSKYASTDGTFNTAIVPLYIIIDIKQHVIKLQGRANVLFTRQRDIPEKRIMFTFHYRDRIAEWSGNFPDHPLYGEWIWDKTVSEEIKNQNKGEKNQALKNNVAVAEAFRKRKTGHSTEAVVRTERM